MAIPYYDRDYERGRYSRAHPEDRGTFERAGDEIRSWFGDDEAERRRHRDHRLEERHARYGRYARSNEDFDSLRAGDVMTRNVVTVREHDTIQHAARLMGEYDCGALPVVDSTRKIIGMITDRDIAVRIAGRGVDPRRARVDECMTDESFTCHAQDSLKNCLHQMARHQIRRLPIVNDRNEIVGIISQADLARHAGMFQGRHERGSITDVLYAVSEPTYTPYR